MDKQTLTRFREYKVGGHKFATLTAYDAALARLAEQAEVECLLVGDSLGNVIQGQRSTRPVSVEEMFYHTGCVSRGITNCFLITDMPFLSYATLDQAIINAATLMRAGAHMVKLEGAGWLEDSVHFMSQRGIPVCAHLGLLPQSAIKLGGYRVQGTDEESARSILDDAVRLEQAGADILLLECVPEAVARSVTESVDVPVVGIGAGPHTDSQVLVSYDMLGISSRIPTFAKNYLEHADSIVDAFRLYAQEVKSGTFPSSEHTLC